jgi:hypothetical protein
MNFDRFEQYLQPGVANIESQEILLRSHIRTDVLTQDDCELVEKVRRKILSRERIPHGMALWLNDIIRRSASGGWAEMPYLWK